MKELGTGPGKYLDFGSLNISNGKQSTGTKAIVAMVDNMRGATSSVFNLRFWVSNKSVFGAGSYYLNGWASGVWIHNCHLTDASGHAIPTSLPSGQNIWRQDGNAEITASGLDAQVTQYYYLSVTANTNVPVGVYGGDAGGFIYRLSVDYK